MALALVREYNWLKGILVLCSFFTIWIPQYAIVAGHLFRILQNEVQFPLVTVERNCMAILKEASCNAPVLMRLDISNGAGHIVVGVDPHGKCWGIITAGRPESCLVPVSL